MRFSFQTPQAWNPIQTYRSTLGFVARRFIGEA